MINKRLNFVKQMGMENFDRFDLNQITDKIKVKKVSSSNKINKYMVDTNSKVKCFFEKTDNNKIISYKTNSNDNYLINNEQFDSFKLGDVEVIKDIINNNHISYKKFIKDILIESYEEYNKGNHIIKIFSDDVYLVIYTYTKDDIIHTISMYISKEEYNALDISNVSNLEDINPIGQWSSISTLNDGRISTEFNSNLSYKRYFYNNDKTLLGFILMDSIKDKIIEVYKTETGFMSSETSISTGMCKIALPSGIKYDVSSTIPRHKLYDDPIINSIEIENIDDKNILISNKHGKYESYTNENVVFNKYNDGTTSKYIHDNGNDIMLYYTIGNEEITITHNDNKINKFIMSNIGIYNTSSINYGLYLDKFINKILYTDKYTNKEVLNDGTMIIYRLNGMISKIDVVSTDNQNNRLEESFIFSLDGSMVNIKQYFYHNNILFTTNII